MPAPLRVDWNTPHMIENAGEANSYSRAQHAGCFEKAVELGAEYIRFSAQFSYHFRAPATLYSQEFVDWFFFSILRLKLKICLILNSGPNIGITSWNDLLPADGRHRNQNKIEPEHVTAVLACWTLMLNRLAYWCDYFGVPRNQIAVQTGNEIGKGGAGDWRPYIGQVPVNPEEASPDGRVPASMVTYTSQLRALVASYGFMTVSCAMEAESVAILTEELASSGWTAVQNAHDKVAVHAYPAGGAANRIKAQRLAKTAYTDRTAVMSGITKPIWVTEVGRLQTDCKPGGAAVAASMALGSKVSTAPVAERTFAFALMMNSNDYAAFLKTELTGTVHTVPSS